MKYPLAEEAYQFARNMLPHIYDGTVDKLTFTEMFGDKITMQHDVAKVKIKRTHTTTLKM